MEMNLLLISNSTNAGEAYLGWPRAHMKAFFEETHVDEVTFVPYAGVSMGYDVYAKRVADVLAEMNVRLVSVHTFDKPADAIAKAQCVLVGGGNTFHLVYEMHRHGLMQAIRERVQNGLPYMGWSAGSNVACPGLFTTNDMPIIQPASFETLNLVPFQINPHYLDAHPDGHAGETREMRIEEFLAANKEVRVAGLREGCMLRLEGNRLALIGSRPLRLFHFGDTPRELDPTDNLIGLM